MSGLKPKIFGIRLVMASCCRIAFAINLQSSFSLSYCGVGWWMVLFYMRTQSPHGPYLLENYKEKEKWQSIYEAV